ncbi:MAG: hypothetical protein D6729_17965 [Deltaproteobacteria bacterium]|nr:MAG: hypothetical protein D6729_17965 [Deltaproteobacteria bacterium]
MHLRLACFVAVGLVSGLLGACGPSVAPDCTATVSAGAGNDQETVQSALVEAQAGDVLCFPAGTYRFTDELTVDTPNLTLRGVQGETVFDFSEQVRGANGIQVLSDGFTIEGITVRDTPGDGIRASGVVGVTFRDVVVEWSGGPSEDNGSYGLYPVESKQVLIERCRVEGASDAGIYVGQSEQIIVRDNVALHNVAGIEIENSKDAEVYGNHAYENTGGFLVFALPGLNVKWSETSRIHDNVFENNNTSNFAPAGNIVGMVPAGTGAILLATDRNEFFGNTVSGNGSVGVSVISYYVTGNNWDDAEYDPFPEGNFVHDNTFTDNGEAPDGIASILIGDPPIPDLSWDGVVDETKDKSDGSLTNCFKDNGDADFINFAYGKPASERSTDITRVTCSHDPLPEIRF